MLDYDFYYKVGVKEIKYHFILFMVEDRSHPFPNFRHKLPGRPTKQFGKQLQTVVTSSRTGLAKNLKNF